MVGASSGAHSSVSHFREFWSGIRASRSTSNRSIQPACRVRAGPLPGRVDHCSAVLVRRPGVVRPTPRSRSSGCTQAPRPAARCRGSGSTSRTGEPVESRRTAGSATTRSKSVTGARWRQPMQVRTGRRRRRADGLASSLPLTGSRIVRRANRRRWPTDRQAPRRLGGIAGRPGVDGLDRRLGVGVDVDPPAGQPRRQPGVLALPADRQGELVVGHDDPGRLGHRIDHGDFAGGGRRQGVADERAPDRRRSR